MFCAIATIIDRCKTEGVVDVFQVVKALRVQKPGAVPTLVSHQCIVITSLWRYNHSLCIIHYAQANYKTLFDATLKFLDSFDTYANFQNI